MTSQHSPCDQVRSLISIDISDYDLPADSSAIVGQMRNPLDSLLSPPQLKPIDNRTRVPFGALPMMRPVGFAGDNILDAIAVHVGQLHGVQFRKADSVGIL